MTTTWSRQSAIVRVSLTDHRCFVHLISVEFCEYNIELVDLVDFRYLNSTQLSDDRLDRFRGLISYLYIRAMRGALIRVFSRYPAERVYSHWVADYSTRNNRTTTTTTCSAAHYASPSTSTSQITYTTPIYPGHSRVSINPLQEAELSLTAQKCCRRQSRLLKNLIYSKKPSCHYM